MTFPLVIKEVLIDDVNQRLYVPDIRAYKPDGDTDIYWARVWPASVALCLFLKEYPEYVADKNVLELAAGVGLPGLFIADKAQNVLITDREKEAVNCMQASATLLKHTNVKAEQLDWNDVASAPLPDIVLMSDVNYAQDVFEELRRVLEYFIGKKCKVLLSTPQRLVAKPFISSMQKYNTHQMNYTVSLDGYVADASVFVFE